MHKCANLCSFLHKSRYLCAGISLLQVGITDTGVIDGLQLLDENSLGVGDVAEGDGALLEVAFLHLCVDESVDQITDAPLGIVWTRTGGSLDGIGHHQDSLLLGEGVGARIGEQQFVDLLIREGILLLHIEVLGLALSMVRGDELLDDIGQIVFIGQLQALGDMADNHLGTFDIRHIGMRIHTRLVLGEINGIKRLSDIMVEGTSTYQLTLRADLIGNLCSQVAHLDGVLEGAWGHFAHAAQQFLIHIRQLDERDVRREAEGFLNEIEQRVGAEQEQTIDNEIVELATVNVDEAVMTHPVEGNVGE